MHLGGPWICNSGEGGLGSVTHGSRQIACRALFDAASIFAKGGVLGRRDMSRRLRFEMLDELT